LRRASTSLLRLGKKDVDGRDKPGHDEGFGPVPHFHLLSHFVVIYSKSKAKSPK
jgi:hypothetical protein